MLLLTLSNFRTLHLGNIPKMATHQISSKAAGRIPEMFSEKNLSVAKKTVLLSGLIEKGCL